MKQHVKLFEDFLNESDESFLNEAMDISDDLKKVKTAMDLKAVVGSKTLVIISKHGIREMNKRGGSWARMNFVRGLDSNNIKIDEIGSFGNARLLDLEYIAFDQTGWSKIWTIDEILEYFLFNKKRGNKIYTVSELPCKAEIKKLLDVRTTNMVRLKTLLGRPVEVGNKVNVAGAKYVVHTDIPNNHGLKKYEFTSKGKEYTYFYNVYGSDMPKLQDGRSTASGGYREQEIYMVDAKSAAEILSLLESNIEVSKKALDVANKFFNSADIKSAK